MGSGLRGSHIGAHRHVHANIAGKSREHGPNDEPRRNQRTKQYPCENKDNDAHDANRPILAIEVGLGALANGAGNLLHTRSARVGFHHRLDRVSCIDKREHAASDDHPQYLSHWIVPFSAPFF